MNFLLFLLLIAALAALYVFVQKSLNLQHENLKLQGEQQKLGGSAQQLEARLRSALSQVKEVQQQKQQMAEQISRYESLSSREEYQRQLDQKIDQRKHELRQIEGQVQSFTREVEILRKRLDELEEKDYLYSFALYEPKYNFDNSEEYQKRLDEVRARQKDLVKKGFAAHCLAEWQVEGSVKKGQKMTQDFLKLVLRAFNGECDAAIAKIKYNNVHVLETRIQKTYEALNKLAETTRCEITNAYFQEKLKELYLTHEYQEKRQQELEEQRQIREQMKEEERALREIEKAKEDADREARRYEQALEKARKEVEGASGQQRDKLEAKLQELERQLAEAQANKERALSRAQQTKSGHVYIISNIGSFGDGVYKLGMTRRLDPMDRVKELGDASVPFSFDVHAIIFSNNAPGLENMLHRRFHHCRVNKANEKKEFFRVSLEEIAAAVQGISETSDAIHGEFHLTKVAEAAEYRRTLAMEQPESVQGAIAS